MQISRWRKRHEMIRSRRRRRWWWRGRRKRWRKKRSPQRRPWRCHLNVFLIFLDVLRREIALASLSFRTGRRKQSTFRLPFRRHRLTGTRARQAVARNLRRGGGVGRHRMVFRWSLSPCPRQRLLLGFQPHRSSSPQERVCALDPGWAVRCPMRDPICVISPAFRVLWGRHHRGIFHIP